LVHATLQPRPLSHDTDRDVPKNLQPRSLSHDTDPDALLLYWTDWLQIDKNHTEFRHKTTVTILLDRSRFTIIHLISPHPYHCLSGYFFVTS
jgi:hypothetical protein